MSDNQLPGTPEKQLTPASSLGNSAWEEEPPHKPEQGLVAESIEEINQSSECLTENAAADERTPSNPIASCVNQIEPTASSLELTFVSQTRPFQRDEFVENAKIIPVEAVIDEVSWREIEELCIASKSAWKYEDAVRATLNQFESLLANKPVPGLLFDEVRQRAENQAFAVEVTEEREIWFLGDVHSDLLALESALWFLKQRSKPVSIVFLGDLFDDGPHGAETVLRVMRLILEDPSAVAVIAGNHDEALGYSADRKEFQSSVDPCEFSEWLNAQNPETNKLAKQLGELTIDLFSRCPRALFFPDGLLAAHGGVPLSDRWNSLVSPKDLNDPICLQDFVWTRPHHRRKRTIPNRSKKGAGLGYEDFSEFCTHSERLFGFPIRWMIRGHDRVDTVRRFASFEAYSRHPIVTINTLCHRLDRENMGEYVREPCIAKYVPGDLPEIHYLRIPPEMVRRFYPQQASES